MKGVDYMEVFACKPNKRTYYFLPFSNDLTVNDVAEFLNQFISNEIDLSYVHIEFETMGFCANFRFRIDIPNLPYFMEYTTLCVDNFQNVTVLTKDQYNMIFRK